MQFFPYTPISMSKAANGLIAGDKQSLAKFWNQVNDELDQDLSEAVSCYIYSIRAGKGILPWYVGSAQKQTFRKECFTIHKLSHYNQAIAARKGTPVLTLIAKLTTGERYARPSGNGHRDIQFLEQMLVGTCIRRNPSLLNIKDTKLLRETVVLGLLNNPKGRDCSSVKEFKRLLGI